MLTEEEEVLSRQARLRLQSLTDLQLTRWFSRETHLGLRGAEAANVPLWVRSN